MIGAMTLTSGSSGKYDGALRDRIDIAGEMEIRQIFQKIFIKDAEASQIIDIFIAEMQIFNIINHLIQTGCDRIAAAAGIFAVKRIKNDRFICICF